MKRIMAGYALVWGLWSGYRLFFKNNIWVEESVIKAIIFSLPWWIAPIKKKPLLELGIVSGNFLSSVGLGLLIGVLLMISGVISQWFKYGGVNLVRADLVPPMMGGMLILALITAFWEQSLFAGYFLAKLKREIKNTASLVVVVGIMFSLIHLPALIIVMHLSIISVLVSLLILFLLGVSGAILRLYLKNLIAPIMAQTIWGMAVFIFK